MFKLFSGRQGHAVIKKFDPDVTEAGELGYELSIALEPDPNRTSLFPHVKGA